MRGHGVSSQTPSILAGPIRGGRAERGARLAGYSDFSLPEVEVLAPVMEVPPLEMGALALAVEVVALVVESSLLALEVLTLVVEGSIEWACW